LGSAIPVRYEPSSLNTKLVAFSGAAFVVIDQAGNRSVEVKQTAFLDNTAPENATNLVFSEDVIIPKI
jgi:hypothetical protein